MNEPTLPPHPLPPAAARGLDDPDLPPPTDDDATVVISASDAEMVRNLATQISAQSAAKQAAESEAPLPLEADPHGEQMTALPISPAQAAKLAATVQASAAPSTSWPPAAAATSTGGSGTHSTLPHGPSFGMPAKATTASGEAQIRQVGRYQVQTRLGRGGMATVYNAHDPSIGRDVAIKFLHASLCEDDECRMRFLREARAAGGLSHPNIVVVHDVGEIENRPYMAMELINGVPLSDTLEKTRKLPIRDVVIMGLQLARALEYAHARGIVHRDIKPGNIMLLADGQTIKVADFGIAHMEEGAGEQRTQVGAVMGTPQYMSPEQTRGDKVDGRSDLFSAGIVLYQMLAGDRPFRGESMVAVVTKIATEDPVPLNQKRPDVPATLRRVVDRCLAKQPAQRYQTGKELADALLKVLGDIDETARELAKPRLLPLRVKWALMMGLIVAVVMGLTATVITQRQYAAMMGQASDYGASLARFIAAQNAANVLGDDWDSVEAAVQEIMKTGSFERISVVDINGQVRVSSQLNLLNQSYKPEGERVSGDTKSGNASSRYASQGEDVLGFDAPILFQGKRVGLVALGIPEKPLTQVARLSIVLMVILAVVTVLAVAIAMYFVANWFAKPIRLVGESMAEIGKGRFDHRIGEHRNDEFGLLFQSFDAMAQALQQREPGAPASPPTLLPTSITALPGRAPGEAQR